MGRFDRRALGTSAPENHRRGAVLPSRWSGHKRLAALGAVAVIGVALQTSLPASAARFSGRAPGAKSLLAARALPAISRLPARTMAHQAPLPIGQGSGASQAKREQAQARSFRQIILADLLIVAPKGLTPAQISQLRKIAGVRDLITFDGAQITAGGRAVSVIGVNPATFRSWVPLNTASDQAFWSALSRGEFVASAAAAGRLKLHAGRTYQVTGATAQVVTFAMAARLGLPGVDLLVNTATSRKLGLVHQVAGLISAPGAGLTALTAKVSKILGPSGRIEDLRSSQLPVASVAPGTRPASYLALFKASAARYCPGLSWTVLAAIGQIESADGTNVGPSTAGAMGPMQFLPSTWAIWGIDGFGETGPPNILDPYDAVPAAARLLCADGAAAGSSSLYHAIFDYNHADWYVNEVLGLAGKYAADYR
jgi:Transglycosylase SLT domain